VTANRPLLDVLELDVRLHTATGIVHAVDDVSLQIDAHETVGIVGESGSGKSMLLRGIMGLLPGGATRSGTVRLAEHELTALKPAELRELWGVEISMVLQNPLSSLNPVRRVGAQVTAALRAHGRIGRRAAHAKAVELLRSVGMPEPAECVRRYPHQLSGGMRQRVAIAAALACDPRLLLADEPTTALDVTVQAQILDLLMANMQQRGMAMILVSHDVGVVAERADRVIVMYAGQIVEQAPAKQLFLGPRTPYANLLTRALPGLDDTPHSVMATIPGAPPDLRTRPQGCRFAPRCPWAQERCKTHAPPLVESDVPGHLYRCWYPLPHPPIDDAGDAAALASGEGVRRGALSPVADHEAAAR
jgi:oligopeptide/dipeptide ABC transporter ATP-binding protein